MQRCKRMKFSIRNNTCSTEPGAELNPGGAPAEPSAQKCWPNGILDGESVLGPRSMRDYFPPTSRIIATPASTHLSGGYFVRSCASKTKCGRRVGTQYVGQM